MIHSLEMNDISSFSDEARGSLDKDNFLRNKKFFDLTSFLMILAVISYSIIYTVEISNLRRTRIEPNQSELSLRIEPEPEPNSNPNPKLNRI